MKLVLLASLLAMLLIVAGVASAKSVMKGIRETLPYHVSDGLIPASAEYRIKTADPSEFTDEFIPITRMGTNHWVYIDGTMGERPFPSDQDPLVEGPDGVKGRWARCIEVDGVKYRWFKTCDNLIILEPICLPPAPCSSPPCETLVAIPSPCSPAPCLSPPLPPVREIHLPCLTEAPSTICYGGGPIGQYQFGTGPARVEREWIVPIWWEVTNRWSPCPPPPPDDDCGPLPPWQEDPNHPGHPWGPPPSWAD